MKYVVKFFRLKVYVWVLVCGSILFIVGGVWGYNKFQNQLKSESSTSILYLEKVDEVVFLNIGIEKVFPKSKSTKILDTYSIPYSEKTKLVKLSYIGKFGIKKPVKIKKISEDKYKVIVPKFEKIGIDFAPGKFIETYEGKSEIFSSSTSDPDSGEAANETLSDKEVKKYIKKYNNLLKESATDYYNNFFKSINDKYTVEVEFTE